MKNDKKRVARARKFVGGLALVIAMSGFTGCSFNKKDADINHDHSYTIENTIESDASYEDTHEHNHEEENVEIPEEEETVEEDEVIEEEEEKQEEESVEENTNNSSKDDTTITQNPVIDVDLSLELPNIGDYQGISIVEALARSGYKFDFSFRKQIAEKLGIQNYRGTAEQNLEMIRLLRQYSESLKQNQDNGVQDPTNQDQNTNNNDNNGNDHDQDIGEPPIHNHNYKLVSSRTRYTNLGERGHRVTKYYTCECGNTITRSSVKNHNITTEQVHENETDEGYDLVTYEVCATCGYKKEISREHVSVHNHVLGETQYDTPVEIANDHVNHSVTSYQECSVCHERVNVRTLTKPHNYTTLPVRYEGGFEYTDEECRECGHSHNLAVNPHNHTLGENHESYNEISGNDDQHEVISYQECSKCHEKVYGPTRLTTHNYGDWSYNDQTDKDERTCSGCGHVQSRTHEEEHTHSWGEYQYKNPTEISGDDVNHNVTRYKKCNGCDETTTEEVVTQRHTYGAEQTKVDGIYTVTYEVCSGCGHIHEISRVHEHDLGEVQYKNPTEISGDDVYHNVTSYQVCSKCHETVNEKTVTQRHTYGDEQTKTEDDYTITYEVCSGCGHVHEISREHNHTFGDWTYNPTTGEDDRPCTGCDFVDHRTHEHNYEWKADSDTTSHQECVCGDKKGLHDHVANSEGKCSVCGADVPTQTETHEAIGDLIVEYTHDNDNYCYCSYHNCSVSGCDEKIGYKEYQHDWKMNSEYSEPADDYFYYECSDPNCGAYLELDHSLSSSLTSSASLDPVGFSARSFAAPAMVEDPEEEEELPLEEVVEEPVEEETNNEEQYNEEQYNEENYNMYVEFIENEYDIEGVNVYITPSSETEEENEEEKGAPVR